MARGRIEEHRDYGGQSEHEGQGACGHSGARWGGGGQDQPIDALACLRVVDAG